MNKVDFECMVGILDNMGFIFLEDFNKVDIILYNICIICDNVE